MEKIQNWKGETIEVAKSNGGLAEFAGHAREGGAQEIPLVAVPDLHFGQGQTVRAVILGVAELPQAFPALAATSTQPRLIHPEILATN
jgi:hypothetical protein